MMIRDNIENIGLEDRSRILRKKVSSGISLLEEEQAQFDIIFMGAPYDTDFALRTLHRLGQSPIVHDETVVIAEVRKNTPLPATTGRLGCVRNETYGDSALFFYQPE